MIPSSDVAATGTAQVSVWTPAPGGGTSGDLPFTIANPVPGALSLSPSSVTAVAEVCVGGGGVGEGAGGGGAGGGRGGFVGHRYPVCFRCRRRSQAGAPAFTLTVTGSGFVSASVVRWNGAARTTTFVIDTQLQASIPASDVAVAGTAQVSVLTPAPGAALQGT